jgi:mRNA interferase MazF
MEAESPQRGEVWIVGFGPSVGGEIQKTHPAVVLSDDTANELLNRVQGVPISSQVARLYPAEACVTLGGERRKVMADQITTVSKLRLRRRQGRLSGEDMEAVGRVVAAQLGLDGNQPAI